MLREVVDGEHDFVAAAIESVPSEIRAAVPRAPRTAEPQPPKQAALQAAFRHGDGARELRVQVRRDEPCEGRSLPGVRDAPHPEKHRAGDSAAASHQGFANFTAISGNASAATGIPCRAGEGGIRAQG